VLSYRSWVVFMLKQLGLNGTGVTPANIKCTPCDASKAGDLSSNTGVVVICQDRFCSKSSMDDTIVHELVHMYDHTKVRVNWSDLPIMPAARCAPSMLSGHRFLTRDGRVVLLT
jgi:inner membrane protease ATP23